MGMSCCVTSRWREGRKSGGGMEAVNVDRLFVVTGGPGSGKSTLIAALAGHGIRSMPDAAAYLRLSELPVPAYLERAAQTFRYHRRVFVAPPWREIFAQDAERKQSFEEAQATYEAVTGTYSTLGYELIPLPVGSVEERVLFVLAAIGME